MTRAIGWIRGLHRDFGTGGVVLIVAATAVMAPIPFPGTVLIPITVAKYIRRNRS